MNKAKRFFLSILALGTLAAPLGAFAADVTHSTVGAGGYDLVSYHTSEKPVPGNGNHLATHEGVTYLFVNEDNRKTFERNPEKYVPAFGGFCAYGVAVKKKFVGDPNVWKIVDGRLYLNLDRKIQGIWLQDVPGNIKKAEANWAGIRDKAPADL